ncbi:MAG: transcription-repair coupling factor, partial [Muribaculaceae bacterium]|nr:transcription-repair coupling factor [Muribaculaceae bacterium]
MSDKVSDLGKLFFTDSRAKAMQALLRHRESHAYGLAGSSAAVLLGSLPQRKSPLLVIGDSLDDAGYLYHDISRVAGEDAVMMFPSGYKRDIKYGQVDPPSQILRTETLSHWYDDHSLRVVVTYPEALAEMVATKDDLDKHTLNIKIGATLDLSEIQQWLRDNGFVEQDYVFEP